MDHRTEDTANSPTHEPIETDVRAVWRTGAVLFVVVIAAYVLILGLMRWLSVSEGGQPATAAQTAPKRGEQNPLQQLRSREQQLLNEYHWVDAETGVARIPVDRAIEIVSQNGLPPALQTSAATDTAPPQQPASR